MKIIKFRQLLLDHLTRLFAFSVSLLLCQTILQAQTLKADYQFQGTFASSVSGSPNIVLTGGGGFQIDNVDGYARQSLRFQQAAGLALNTQGVVPNNAYTAVILFRFDNVGTGGRRRIFDSTTGASNLCGLYMVNSRLEVEPASVTTIVPSTFIQVAIVKQTNGQVRVIRDGYNVLLNDSNGCYLNQNNVLRFFLDDTATPGEVSAGNVARIRLYDAPMTVAQVQALDRVPNANGGGDQTILFSTNRHDFPEIYSMNSNGANQRRLTNNAVADYQARWSPDKSKIVFTRAEKIWLMNADGSGQTQLTNSAASDHAPSYKPDGSKILFTRCPTSTTDCDIYTMNADGTDQQTFPGAAAPGIDEDLAAYSPDGSKIIFTRSDFTNTNTSGIASVSNGATVLLTNNTLPVGDLNARFSPDGSKIAFARYPTVLNPTSSSNVEIYTMSSQGGAATNITNNSVFDNNPVWLSNNRRLAFNSSLATPLTGEIFTMGETGAAVSRLTFNSSGEAMCDFYQSAATSRTPFDFDGDGRADLSVFRGAEGVWYINGSQSEFSAVQFGSSTDKLVPADYDGDGKTDVAVYRDNPDNPDRSNFYILNSSDNTVRFEQFGRENDNPSIVGDWDGDQKADLAVYRQGASVGLQSYFYYRPSSQTGVGFVAVAWGVRGDRSMTGDFDGDGKRDAAIFRPSEAVWYIRGSQSGSVLYDYWGVSTDRFVPADYDGDGTTDLAIFRNGIWYIKQSTGGTRYENFGVNLDQLAPADYDGDGKADLAVFRNGVWFVKQSQSASVMISSFGSSSDTAVPGAFVNP